MNNRKNLHAFTVFCLVALVFFGAAHAAAAATTWTGGSATTNGWSDGLNWDTATAPGPVDSVLFANSSQGATNVQGAVNNTVDVNLTVSSVSNLTTSPNGFHTTFIKPGVSLNLAGSDVNMLWVGAGVSLTTETINRRFVGPGTLTVTNATGVIQVVNFGTAADHFATLDLSGLTNFAANVSQLVVGGSTFTGEANQMGTMLLAETNFIQTAAGTSRPGIVVASQNNGSTAIRGTQQLFLGRNNLIHSDAIAIGGTKMAGQLLFRVGLTGAVATIRGSAGGTDRVKLFTVGDERAGIDNYIPGTTGVGNSGVFDGTGNFLDVLATDLFVARSQTNSAGATTATLTFDQGIIDADNMYVGFHPGPPVTGAQNFNGTGTVNVNGNATLTVNNDLLLTRKLGTAVPVANLNLSSNGTVNVKGNINSSNGVSTINFNNGGTIDMQPAADVAPGNVFVSTVNGSGLITNAASVTVSNLNGSVTIATSGNVTDLTLLSPGTAATAGTLSIGGNFTLATNATLIFNLTNVTTVGGNANDLISVTGDLNLNSNGVVFVPTVTTLASGSYRVFDYTGTRNGFFNFTNSTRYAASLDYPANQVNVTISGSSGNVRWNSAANALWDLTTSNWFNTGTAAVDRFFQLDSVLVDAAGSYTNLLLLTSQHFPGVVTVNSSTRDYFFGGAGRISGAAGIIKQGTSSLSISNANDFTGPVAIGGGILRVANATALGSITGGTFATNGGTLDINGIALNTGEVVTISGTGLTSTGAVINAGAQQTSGLRFVNLVGDASVGAWGTRWDIRGTGGAGSYNGEVNLNGFTFTKVGGAALYLVDCNVTNVGSFDIQGGMLAFARCQVDGPGTINVRSNIVSFESSSVGYNTKPVIVNGGTIRNAANTFVLFAPVTNLTGMTIDAAATLTFTNVIVGAGGVTKVSAANATFLAPNTYSGPTVINAGQLTLGTNASIASSSGITVSAGAILDVSAISGFTLASGQTLSGSGTIVGDVVANASNTLIPGTSPGTLSFSNNVTLNGVSNVFELGSDPTQVGGGQNDLVAAGGNMTLTGTIKIKILPIAPLSDVTPYTLFKGTNSLNASAATFQISSDNPRYTFVLVDPATTPGSIQVSVIGVPTTLAWRGGQAGGPTTWNLTLSNWLNGASLDTFFSGDSVKFDDSALTNAVSIPGQLQPGSITVSNESLAYRFAGASGFSAGGFVKQGAAPVNFTNAGPVNFSAGMNIAGGDVRIANGSTNTLGGFVAINAGSLTFANPANNFGSGITLNGGTLTLTQAIDQTISVPLNNDVPSVAGTLVKAGNNTLTLSGNSTTFDGPIMVNSGTLKAGSANALGTGAADTTIASGATFEINGFALATSDLLHISGAGLSSTGAVINSGAAAANALRGIVLDADAAIGAWGSASWDLRPNGGAGSFSGVVSLNNHKLTKLGQGNITFVDAVFSDPTVIDITGGQIQVARCSVPAIGFMNLSNNIMIFNNYSAGTFSMPVIVNGAIIRIVGSPAFSFDSPLTNLAAGLTFDNSAAAATTLTAAGTISGPGALAKTGTATVILTAADSTWAGSTTIAGGTLQIGSGNFDGSLPDLPIIDNGTLAFNSQTSFTITNQISGSGGIQQIVGGTITLTASNSYAGQTLLSGLVGTSPNGSAARISHNNALGDTTGATRIAGGATSNARLELVGNITSPEPLELGGRNTGTTASFEPHVANISGTNTLTGTVSGLTGGTQYNFRSDAGKLIVAGTFVPPSTVADRILKLMGGAYGEWSGVIGNSADTIVPTILVKTNSGTWTLSGTNLYFGSTTIWEGVLALGATGSISNTPSIDVQTNATFNVAAVTGGFVLGAGQTLKGNGTVVGNVIANGTVSPGASIGTLTFANNLVLAGTNVMEIDRDATPNADLIVANVLTYGGTLVVNNLGQPLLAGDTFNLFDFTTRNGSFAAISLPTLDPGLTWDTSSLAVNGTIKIFAGTAPPSLTFQVTGNTLEISWPNGNLGWRLEGQTNAINVGIRTNWFTVPNSTTTNRVILTIDPANKTTFYRLANP